MNNVYIYWTGKLISLIRVCRELLYLHAKLDKTYNVILLTPENIVKYIEIPTYFSTLKPAHQADYVRVMMLYEYGGIWVDSDILVIDGFKSFFEILEKYDAFFITERDYLYNGIFGSRPKTLIMELWKKAMIDVLNKKESNIEWTEIGNKMVSKIYSENKFDNIKIIEGSNTVYPVDWEKIYEMFVQKPYATYANIEKEYQPIVILISSVYRSLEHFRVIDVLRSKFPMNYFIDKSIANITNKILENVQENPKDFINKFWDDNLIKDEYTMQIKRYLFIGDDYKWLNKVEWYVEDIKKKYNLQSVGEIGRENYLYSKQTSANLIVMVDYLHWMNDQTIIKILKQALDDSKFVIVCNNSDVVEAILRGTKKIENEKEINSLQYDLYPLNMFKCELLEGFKIGDVMKQIVLIRKVKN